MANIGPDNFELVKELLGDKNTMNRSTLEEVLFEELGFSREMSRVFVTQFFQTISDVLATGEEVKLTTLGRFEICGRAYKCSLTRRPRNGLTLRPVWMSTFILPRN